MHHRGPQVSSRSVGKELSLGPRAGTFYGLSCLWLVVPLAKSTSKTHQQLTHINPRLREEQRPTVHKVSIQQVYQEVHVIIDPITTETVSRNSFS